MSRTELDMSSDGLDGARAGLEVSRTVLEASNPIWTLPGTAPKVRNIRRIQSRRNQPKLHQERHEPAYFLIMSLLTELN